MFFLIFTVIIFNAICLMSPKKLTKIEIYTTCLFAMVLQLHADIHLAAKYEFYGYFERKSIDFKSLIVFFGVYPAVNFLFLNFYPEQKCKWKKVYYIIAWSLFSVFYEYLALQSYFYHSNSWKLWISGIIYPFLFLLLIGSLKLVRYLLNFEYERKL